jgi:ppGpp synthetase/RelA/SpoT-type nucleotidyltranferase
MARHVDRKWLAREVKACARQLNRYKLYATWLDAVLNHAARRICETSIVQTRAKKVESFAGKCVRRWPEIQHPSREFTDLCGGRIILQLLSEVEEAEAWVRQHFRIDEANSGDKRAELEPHEFGYLSVHLIVLVDPRKLPPDLRADDVVKQDKRSGRRADAEEDIELRSVRPRKRPPRLTDDDLARLQDQIRVEGPRLTREMWDQLAGLPAEVQLRTMAQHAWSDVGHDRIYKSAFEVPADYKRQNAEIAALLEAVDEAFSNLVEGVRELETNVGTYHDREETLKNIEQFEAILAHDKKNVRLAAKLARRLISIGEYDRAIRAAAQHYPVDAQSCPELDACTRRALCLKNGGELEPPEMEKGRALLRGILPDHAESCPELNICIGRALCLKNSQAADAVELEAGRALLRGVLQDQPMNVEAATFLAESYAASRRGDEALASFESAFQIDPTDPAALAGYLRHRIADDHNLFFVSMERPNLEQAIRRCQAQVDVRVNLPYALYRMAEFHLLLCAAEPQALPGTPRTAVPQCHTGSADSHVYEGLYCLCRAISLTTDPAVLEVECRSMDLLVQRLQNQCPDSIRWAELTLQLAIAARVNGQAENVELSAKAAGLRSDDRVLIIAGGCNEKENIGVEENRGILEAVIDEFASSAADGRPGVVICGGTKEGISGATGEICAAHRKAGRLRVIGYVPRYTPRGATRDERRYELHDSEGTGVSPLEAIQAWRDLLDAGIQPRDVKLVGINGGRIAAFEYHLAAALAAVNAGAGRPAGGQVAIVSKSGRVADELMLVADAPGNEYIQFFPADPESYRAFIAYPASLEIPRRMQTRLGQLTKLCDEVYRTRMHEIRDKEDARKIDAKLKEAFSQSTREQAQAIPAKLRRIGKCAVFVGKRKAKPHPLSERKGRNEVEEIARMEHGRWVAERVRSGWRYGAKRDNEKRLRPSLVPWDELPQDEKDKDLDHAREIPHILAKIGFEIRTIASRSGRK